MTTTTSPSPFDAPLAPLPLVDPFADAGSVDLVARPPRTEDRVPRDKRGKPRILPPGEAMPADAKKRDRALRSYMRPSSYAKVLEDTFRLERWSERKAAVGLMGERSLQLALAALGDPEESSESKQAADEIIKKAKESARASEKADTGTALHAITERHDRGLPISFVPEEFKDNLEDWKRLTEHVEILDIECFVVQDEIRAAGTFDRLVRYHEPCGRCGAYLRIGDLKSGRIDYSGMVIAGQLAIYANGCYYDPETGERREYPEQVCKCAAIVWHIPSGEAAGTGEAKWVNIAQGWDLAVSLSRQVREARKMRNWWLTPDIMPLIRNATTRAELNALYCMHRSYWREDHTNAGNARIEELGL